MIKYNKLSIREKQALGALCILSFCKECNIKYIGVSELCNHLLSLLITENLMNWNNNGLTLNIIGRGEPFPEELNTILPYHLKDVFYDLVDNVIEIGIVDLFGEFTDYPNKFLTKALNIVKEQKIILDFPAGFFTELNQQIWGEVWSVTKYNDLISYIEKNYYFTHLDLPAQN